MINGVENHFRRVIFKFYVTDRRIVYVAHTTYISKVDRQLDKKF